MYVCDLCNLSNGKGKSTVGSFVLYASRHQGPAPQELPRGLNGLQTLLEHLQAGVSAVGRALPQSHRDFNSPPSQKKRKLEDAEGAAGLTN